MTSGITAWGAYITHNLGGVPYLGVAAVAVIGRH